MPQLGPVAARERPGQQLRPAHVHPAGGVHAERTVGQLGDASSERVGAGVTRDGGAGVAHEGDPAVDPAAAEHDEGAHADDRWGLTSTEPFHEVGRGRPDMLQGATT